MIWGIVLIPIGLLMAIGIVIFLLSLITIVRFRRRHGIMRPLMWREPIPRDRTSPSSHGGRSVAAVQPAHRLWDFAQLGIAFVISAQRPLRFTQDTVNMAKAASGRTDHIPALDGLRGVAASIVVVSHVSYHVGFWGGGGQIGVMLFFVLSGFLMGFLYLRRPFSAVQVWNYAVHRGARVLPLFYVVAVAALLLRRIGVESYPALKNGISLLTLIEGSDVFWTIPVEIQFYALFVGLWALYSRLPYLALGATLILGAVLFAIHDARFASTLLSGAPFFVSGVLTSRLGPSIAGRLSAFSWSVVMLFSFTLALLAFPGMGAVVFGGALQVGSPLTDQQLWQSPLCLAAASGCLIVAVYSPGASLVLSTRPMIHLGRVSYSLYLLHMPVLIMLYPTPLSHRPILFLAATLFSSIVVATVVEYVFEAPARRLVNEWLAAENFAWLLRHRLSGSITRPGS